MMPAVSAICPIEKISRMKKSTKILLAINVGLVLLIGFSIYRILDRRQHRDTAETERQFAVAVSRLTKSEIGDQRVEVFVKALKAINPGQAPAEVKLALQEYTAAWEQTLAAVKAGQPAETHDAAIAAAKEKLMASFRKYE
jgi:hypothetical protein